MTTFNWSIEKLTVTGDQNVVTQAHWRCDAVNGDLTAACAGVRDLVLGDTFTAYARLTEQQVLNWCFEPQTIVSNVIVSDEQTTSVKNLREETEADLINQIQSQINRKQSEPSLPW